MWNYDNEDETMKLKDYISDILLCIAVAVILFIFERFSIFESFKNHLKNEITIADIIAVLTVFTLAAGVLYYQGVHKRAQKEYHLKKINLSLRYRFAILGAMFVSAAVLVSMPAQEATLLLILIGLIICSGYFSEIEHGKKVILKMITLDESGDKRLVH